MDNLLTDHSHPAPLVADLHGQLGHRLRGLQAQIGLQSAQVRTSRRLRRLGNRTGQAEGVHVVVIGTDISMPGSRLIREKPSRVKRPSSGICGEGTETFQKPRRKRGSNLLILRSRNKRPVPFGNHLFVERAEVGEASPCRGAAGASARTMIMEIC
jgi:hypothetical protein